MSLNGTTFEKKQRPIPPQGPQVATCYSIVDVGTHNVSFQGQPPKPTPLVHFSWELPNLPHQVFDEAKGPQPLSLFQEYTVSLGDKSKLCKMLTLWRGVAPVDLAKELPVFLGQSCYINVEYKKDKQKPEITYANVAGNGIGIMRLPQGTPVGPLTNPKMFFNLDNYSHAEFIKLPKWLQKKIQSSLEWSGIVAKFGTPPIQEAVQGTQQAPAMQNNNFQQNTNFQQVNQNQLNPPSFGGEVISGNPFANDGPPF
jgi:hypothetical protein